MNIDHHLPTAIVAAEEACKVILDVYNSGDFQAEAKGDNSPLTIADRKAHGVISVILEATNLPVLSEEGKTIPYEERSKWEYFWMVDPLDGTKEFIKRNGEFTVNIALIHAGKPVLGVVAVPVTGELFFASENNGAFKRHNGKDTALPRRDAVNLSAPALRVVASRSHLNQETTDFIDQLVQPVLVSQGSSLKFMLMAEGKADVYPRYAPTMEWDTAAAHAIVSEVGLKVLQADSKEQLVYNKPDLLNPFFIVL